MDYRLEQFVNGPAGHHPAWDAVMRDVSAWSVPLFAWIVISWFALGWMLDRPADRRGAVTALLAAGAALLVNQAVLVAWQRPRPFAAHPGTVHTLVAHAGDASFPSDHAAASAAIATTVLLFHRRLGLAALALAALLWASRVYVGVHYPGDVLAGAAVGAIAAVVLTVPLGPAIDRLLARLEAAAARFGVRPPRRFARGPVAHQGVSGGPEVR